MMQAAQAQHEKEVASHKSAYTTLDKDFEEIQEQLQQQTGSMASLQTQLIQVQHRHILLFAKPFSPITLHIDYATMLLSPFVLNRRLAVSQACVSPAM